LVGLTSTVDVYCTILFYECDYYSIVYWFNSKSYVTRNSSNGKNI